MRERNETAYNLVMQINEIKPEQWGPWDEQDYQRIDAALRRAKAEVLEAAAKHFRGEIMDPDGKEYLEGYNSALRHVSAWIELDADAHAAQIEEGE